MLVRSVHYRDTTVVVHRHMNCAPARARGSAGVPSARTRGKAGNSLRKAGSATTTTSAATAHVLATTRANAAGPSLFSALEKGGELHLSLSDDASFCFSVATVPRPWYKDNAMPELKHIQRSSTTSWVNAGAEEVLWLTGTGEDYDMTRLELRENVSRKCRTVSGLQSDFGNIPLISSAFKLADSSSKCEFVVFMNTDIFVLPSFGSTLKAVVRAMPDVNRFLLVGHRIGVVDTPADIENVVSGPNAERNMQRRWVDGAFQPNPHAMDVFVWRRGSYQHVPIPPFLIGRNIWDLWLWSYAVRNWKTIQGGNVFFVFHPSHDKPHQNLREYDENTRRANLDPSQSVSCSRIDCAEFFLNSGKCRALSKGEIPHLSVDFCLVRRKQDGTLYPPPHEEKLEFTSFKFIKDPK